MKTLDDISAEIAHLQRRVDYLQCSLQGLLPIILSIAARTPSGNTGENFKTEFATLLDAFSKIRDQNFAKSSEWPVTVNYLGSDPLEYAIDCNRERRHESIAERATAAAKLANLKVGNVKAQHSASPIGEAKPLVTREEAAKKLGVSGSSIDRARAVLAKGTPEVIEQMSKGEITVNEAFENVKKGRPIAEKSILREGLM